MPETNQSEETLKHFGDDVFKSELCGYYPKKACTGLQGRRRDYGEVTGQVPGKSSGCCRFLRKNIAARSFKPALA